MMCYHRTTDMERYPLRLCLLKPCFGTKEPNPISFYLLVKGYLEQLHWSHYNTISFTKFETSLLSFWGLDGHKVLRTLRNIHILLVF